MSNIDFITEKWRTIRYTRKLANIHMLSSVVPLIYVAVYAEAQREAKDDKELGAAMAALLFNLIQFLRTVMGKVQLNVFAEWCKHAVECIRALQGALQEMNELGGDSGRTNDGIVRDMEKKIKVNNTIVDNELGGTDVTISPSLEKMLNGLKKWEFKPSKWLKTDQAKLSTVRWCGAYLCGMGEHWNVQELVVGSAAKTLGTLFSSEMTDFRWILKQVTWNLSEKKGGVELLSIVELGDESGNANLKSDTETAYGCEIRNFGVSDTLTIDSYSFEFESLVGSYPASNEEFTSGNREQVAIGLVHSVLLAKHLGVEKLKAIRRYYDRYRMPSDTIFCNALKLLLKQSLTVTSDESEILNMLLTEFDIPIFPYRMQLIPLWEQDTNWRVLQATAHLDIESSMKICLISSFEDKLEAESVFDYYKNIARDKWFESNGSAFLGVVIETVRTFLAKWLATGVEEPNWEPLIPNECFGFELSKNLCNVQDCNIEEHTLIWICQQELQREVSRTWREYRNLPSSHVLVMLFLLGVPNIEVVECEIQEKSGEILSPDMETNSALTSSVHQSVKVSVREYRIEIVPAPQKISLRIRIDFETLRISVVLENRSNDSCFMWQDWVDAAMGSMKGYDECTSAKLKLQRTIGQTNLREPIVEICPLYRKNDSSVQETRAVGVWMGWLPFDVQICQFEVEHWLAACNINLAALQKPQSEDGLAYAATEQIKRAEEVIRTIVANMGENEQHK